MSAAVAPALQDLVFDHMEIRRLGGGCYAVYGWDGDTRHGPYEFLSFAAAHGYALSWVENKDIELHYF